MGRFTIWQKGKHVENSNVLLEVVAAISSYICIFSVLLIDFFLWQFQLIYFGIHKIPKIKRSDYLRFDRAELSKLNWAQKLNCVYCTYMNGILAFGKAVTNQMEIYSCAIRHVKTPAGHEHQKNFYDRKRFK